MLRKSMFLSLIFIFSACSLIAPAPEPAVTPPVVAAVTETPVPLDLPTEEAPELPVTSTFTPAPVEVNLPDLTAQAFAIDTAEPISCMTPDTVFNYGVSVQVFNNGTADAGPFSISVGDEVQTLNGLSAQASEILFFGEAGSDPNPTVAVDINDEVVEESEDNNRSQEPLPIPTPPPMCTPTPQPAAPLSGFDVEFMMGGFAKPLYVTHAFDERLFVVQQTGQIMIIENGIKLDTPFLDISDRVNDSGNEQGLLGLAFHPDHQFNGRFFVNYTDANGSSVVSEFLITSDRNVAIPSSERKMMTVAQPFRNHNGGHIAFGGDGNLYIGLGDGGSQNDPENHAQNPNSLLGKILRIDVDNGDPYGIPADNPFVGNDAARNEIWSLGWRNPWRFSFDRLTQDMFVGDVGQNQIEEISYNPAAAGGLNYGWRIFEGTACYLDDCLTPNLVNPIGEYSHAGGHCSVTGGYVYRGSQQPALYGNYIFADYCSGTFWRLFPNGNGSWSQAEIGRVNFLVSSFGEDASGELYVVNQGGEIYRLVGPSNQTN
ncbi:MAG: PQQ-dependent sugar dehydrogenase [Chloroflexota bacterium]